MSAEHIAFDEDDDRSLRGAARWLIAAAIANLLVGVSGWDTDPVSITACAAMVVVAVTLFVAALRIRAIVTTDVQDQQLLGRALGSLQVALLVRMVWVSLLAISLLAVPFLFGGMALLTALRW